MDYHVEVQYLFRAIEYFYDKATSAVQMNGSIGEWLRTTVAKLGKDVFFYLLSSTFYSNELFLLLCMMER